MVVWLLMAYIILYICIYIYIYTYTYIHIYIYILHLYVYILSYYIMYIYIYKYICIRMCIYIYTLYLMYHHILCILYVYCILCENSESCTLCFDQIWLAGPLVSSAPWLAGKSPVSEWRFQSLGKSLISMVHGFQHAMFDETRGYHEESQSSWFTRV